MTPFELKIMREFQKPIFENKIFLNLFYLKSNAKKMKMTNPRWNYNVKLLCLDIYNSPEIYPVILLLNNCSSITQFYFDEEFLMIDLTILEKVL